MVAKHVPGDLVETVSTKGIFHGDVWMRPNPFTLTLKLVSGRV